MFRLVMVGLDTSKMLCCGLLSKDVNGQVLPRLKSRGSLPNEMESARTAGKADRVQH